MTEVVGYAPGAYDLFHVGHLNLLRRASRMCNYLIAGVLSDELCFHVESRLPVVPLEERLEIVGAVDVVDAVHVELVPDKLVTWRELHFDRIFLGDNWRGTRKGDQLERRLAAVGVNVVHFPYTHQTSSTLLRLALQERVARLQV